MKIVYDKADRLIKSYDKGKMIKDGVKTVIVGRPNVGKSTLLNSLLRENRAIVTEIEGTTRDTIEESINIKGINLVLIDTAGIRKTEDIVEKIGVQKSIDLINEADLVLMIIDNSRPLANEDLQILEQIKENNKKAIILINKIDLPSQIDREKLYEFNIIEISAMKNIGIEQMEDKLYSYITEEEVENSGSDKILTNIRHKTALEKTKQAIENIFETIDNQMPLDLISVDLKQATDCLSEITGEITSEDILDHIFSNFCVGK